MRLIKINPEDGHFKDVVRMVSKEALDKYDLRDKLLDALQRDFSLSPADLASLGESLNAGALRVLEGLRTKIQAEIEWFADREKEGPVALQDIRSKIGKVYRAVLASLTDLESKHLSPGALDEMRRVQEEARAWKITEEWLREIPKQVCDFTKARAELALNRMVQEEKMPDNELISRKQVKKIFNPHPPEKSAVESFVDLEWVNERLVGAKLRVNKILAAIDNLPSVHPVPKAGEPDWKAMWYDLESDYNKTYQRKLSGGGWILADILKEIKSKHTPQEKKP